MREQNARQKQRKIYENQPNNSYYETEDKKSNINYTCKKCNLVFQRYYELIRHQKNHCFKEENNKKSAKAQIAAAQIAQNLSSEDSNSSMDINSSVGGGGSAGTGGVGGTLLVGCVPNVTGGGGGSSQNLSLSSPNNENPSPNLNLYKSTCLSPQQSSATQQTFHQQIQQQPTTSSSAPSSTNNNKYECDKCNLTFPRHDIYKEHQLIHLMNPNLLLNQQLMNPTLVGDNSPFSLLQNMTNAAAAAAGNLVATTSENNDLNSGGGGVTGAGAAASAAAVAAAAAAVGATVDLTMQKKRKLSESSDTDLYDLKSLSKKYKNDQFDFLYNYFLQNEPNEELKKQDKHMMDFDSLYQYYQMSELKKKGGNFDYLYQYYLQNEKNQKLMVSPTLRNSKSPALDPFGGEKPPIDFLFQYYQINESKKFFQLDLPLSAAPNHAEADLMAQSFNRRHKPAPIPDAKADNLNQTTLMKQMLSLLQQQHQQQVTLESFSGRAIRFLPKSISDVFAFLLSSHSCSRKANV